VQVYNPRIVEAKQDNNVVPAAQPAASPDGPKASQVFQNVKVLGDLSVGEFTRLMVSMTAWVAPQQGCSYCHAGDNMADDSKYTKIVARRMVEMTQHINADWKPHVANTGVTCYTCHRGEPVPKEVWFKANAQPQGSNFIGDKAGQNSPADSVNLSSLPNDPYTPFLLGKADIRVNGPTALPSGNRHSTKQAEFTYGLMTHMSTSLGVNCTYCHNSRSFQTWEGGPPQRTTAWHGIQMARDLNLAYLEPLTASFPANRKGELGDVAKVNCATCHQGAYKPLNGAAMLKDHPELGKYTATATAAAAPAASLSTTDVAVAAAAAPAAKPAKAKP
jgi:photosynthetic reaction center cytochrome c subunit